MTVTSSTTAYCTPALALQFYDVTMWGDLVEDTGNRVSASGLTTDANLAAELQAASGEVEEYCFRGGRYQPADLAALQSPMTMGGMRLAKLTATVAMMNTRERRDPWTDAPPAVLRVYDSLRLLADGIAIFGFQEVQEAGIPEESLIYQDQQDAMRSPVWKARRLFGNHQFELTQF